MTFTPFLYGTMSGTLLLDNGEITSFGEDPVWQYLWHTIHPGCYLITGGIRILV